MNLVQKRVQRAGDLLLPIERNRVQARSPSTGALLQTHEEGSWLAYIRFTFALKAIHITLSRAFKPQFTRESRVTHARGLSTRCEHEHNVSSYVAQTVPLQPVRPRHLTRP